MSMTQMFRKKGVRVNFLFHFQTPLEYKREYLNLTKHTSRYHGYAYDGVWAAALAIQEVGRKAHYYNTSLAEFTYRFYVLLNYQGYYMTMGSVLAFIKSLQAVAVLSAP